MAQKLAEQQQVWKPWPPQNVYGPDFLFVLDPWIPQVTGCWKVTSSQPVEHTDVHEGSLNRLSSDTVELNVDDRVRSIPLDRIQLAEGESGYPPLSRFLKGVMGTWEIHTTESIDSNRIHIGSFNAFTPDAVELKPGGTIRRIPMEQVERAIISDGEPVLPDVYLCVHEYAKKEAEQLQHHFVSTEHLLLGLLHIEDSTGTQILHDKGVEPDAVRKAMEQADLVPSGEAPLNHLPLTPSACAAFVNAARKASGRGTTTLETEHLLLALLNPNTRYPAAQILSTFDVTYDSVKEVLPVSELNVW